MNINILRYFLLGIAGGQEVDRNFFKFQKIDAKIQFLLKNSQKFKRL